jgi:hypothetical protein
MRTFVKMRHLSSKAQLQSQTFSCVYFRFNLVFGIAKQSPPLSYEIAI